ncbi:MAG: GTP cyclohydrolase I FolE2 [Treponema sp.]|nr:GTP cyclohydrolase I FolE2 [Treponema sp.]
MRDIQNEQDTREIPLQKVGVKGVKYPVCVLDKNKKVQHTTAQVDLFVNLPHNFKGTHMSRFIEVFHKYHTDITMLHFLDMLEEMRKKLDAQKAYGSIKFPYFIEKKAPVTGAEGIMQYECSYEGECGGTGAETLRGAETSGGEDEASGGGTSGGDEDESLCGNASVAARKFFVTIQVPIATLCPCSKAISEYGAHNQRGFVKVKLLYHDFFWIEDVIEMIENCASTPLYTLLKRKDEKHVTEYAYDNPRFVEDVVREVYLGLKKMNFKWFTVEAETEESIHNHNAYACAEFLGVSE